MAEEVKKFQKYHVTLFINLDVYMDVEAPDEDTAVEIARERYDLFGDEQAFGGDSWDAEVMGSDVTAFANEPPVLGVKG